MSRKNINYKNKVTILICLVLLAAPLLVQAAGLNPSDNSLLKNTADAGSSAGYDVSKPVSGLAEIVGIVVQTFLSLIGVLFISYAVYGGFLWMTAAGNDEKVSKAKDILRNGIIGLVVVFSAAGIYYAAAAIFNPQYANLGNF